MTLLGTQLYGFLVPCLQRAQELLESRRTSWVPVRNSPCGVCGRKATLKKTMLLVFHTNSFSIQFSPPPDLKCDFEQSLCLWINSNITTARLQWHVHKGTTLTANTGPDNDHTLGNGELSRLNLFSC